MGRVVVKKVIKRRPGHLYYIDAQGNVCEAKMARGGKKKKKARKRVARRRPAKRKPARRKRRR